MTSPPPTPPASGRGEKAVTLAAIIGAHGIGGEVRLKVFAEGLAAYDSFNQGALTLKSLRHGSNGAIARFAEIADRNAAEAMRGTALTVPRSALPPLGEGEYYHIDVIGLPCLDEAGVNIGKIVTIENFGAGDIIEVEKPDGKRFMAPIHAAQLDADKAVIDPAYIE